MENCPFRILIFCVSYAKPVHLCVRGYRENTTREFHNSCLLFNHQPNQPDSDYAAAKTYRASL